MNTPEFPAQPVAIPEQTAKRRPPKRMRGWVSIEVGIGIAFVAIMLFFLGPRITEMFAGGRSEQAFVELTDIILVSERYRSVNGNYSGISVFALHTNGYGLLKQKSIATAAATAGINVYGLAMQVASASSNADASITYTFKDSQSCAQILDRIKNYPQVKGTPACASATNILTVTIE